MPRISAGLLLYRSVDGVIQVLLVHPGGLYFKNKDEGAWTIPKGEPDPDKELLIAAQREFKEETGITPSGPFLELSPIKQKGGKIVHAWGFESDCDPSGIVSNTFEIEWPPKSGQMVEFPERDRAAFFGLVEARMKINPAQVKLVDELENLKLVPKNQ